MSVGSETMVDARDPDSDVPPSIRPSKERQICDTDPSGAGRSMHLAAGWLSATLLLIAAALTGGGVWLLRSHASHWLAPAAFVTGVFFFICGALVPLGVIRENGFQTEEKKNCESACEDLWWALKAIGDHTLTGLAWVNFRQLRMFTVIAQRQARMSYYASLVAAAISLLVLTSGAAVAIGLPATSAKIAAGALATAGTVLSGFLVKTFLRAYQMASRQMSYYYGQPLVHCYLLHAEWLTREAHKHFGDEAGLSLWREVVDGAIKASASAQQHLLSMQECESKRHGKGSARPQ
jgi:Cyanobacterial TRADD-N associated 2-Transmembrane domain